MEKGYRHLGTSGRHFRIMTPLPPLGSFAFGAATLGDYESIATVTVGSGGASAIDFTSIPSTYKHLQIRYIARATTGGIANFTMTFNGTGSGYSYHGLYGDGSSVAALGTGSASNMLAGVISSTATTFSTGVIDILDYANTNKYKIMRDLNGADWNGSGYAVLYSGSFQYTNAITQVSFGSATFAQYSHFALYGIKG